MVRAMCWVCKERAKTRCDPGKTLNQASVVGTKGLDPFYPIQNSQEKRTQLGTHQKQQGKHTQF